MFFTYDQNNSGGDFTFDAKKGISCDVIIEAANATDANLRAEEIGLYFDGVSDDMDCGCCGDRWYRAYEGTEKPEKYGEEVVASSVFEGKGLSIKWIKNGPNGYIHYLDGRIIPFGL
jgi:hypothetical protein